jgi:hypothetical protein
MATDGQNPLYSPLPCCYGDAMFRGMQIFRRITGPASALSA